MAFASGQHDLFAASLEIENGGVICPLLILGNKWENGEDMDYAGFITRI
ncbi:hypothetical protein CASFOL_003504 [Castilleja foliolosa]|uniref:Uncharacterized protein n=1 Tax=Castilleja foliolosa TaxID=1961234 RepID=A0ABD3EHP8_9LAMI